MKNRIYRHSVFIFLGLIYAVVTGVAQAQPAPTKVHSSTQATDTQNSKSSEARSKAQEWGLQPEEWQRYKEVMDGPLGIYSPGLDPLTALGISARTDQERRQYAEKQVLAEMRRVERELAYQRAYDDAFKRMFPSLMPVDFNNSSQMNSVAVPSGDGRLAIFVKENCPPCEAKVKQLQT
ncbi:MAG: TIGR03759 family integrating conjugative element protein, partial [Saezia sp.]